MQVPHELLAELDASDEVEFHIVPEDARRSRSGADRREEVGG
jgi:hypothetical protein